MEQVPNIKQVSSSDGRLIVKLGVPMAPEIPGFSYNQKLNNGVEITAFGENCHFLQFITKQYSDDGKTFENLGQNYMRDKDTPRWAVDCIPRVMFETKHTMSAAMFKREYNMSPDEFKPPYSPFYDEGGASFKDKDKLIMFDQPGYSNDNERVIFATFLIENNKATKMVLWSKEYIDTQSEEPEMVYTCHAIKNIDVFPQWAIKAMRDEYQTNGILETVYLSMNFNEALEQILNKEPLLTPENEQRTLKESFPIPPSNWFSLLKDLYYPPISSSAKMMLMGVASTHPTPESEVKKDVKVEEEKKVYALTLSTPQTDQRENKTNDKGDEPKQGFTPTGM